MRQEAFAAAKEWRKAKTKAEPGAAPNGGPTEGFGNSEASKDLYL